MRSVMIWGDPETGKSALIARLTNSTEVCPSYRLEKNFAYVDYQSKGTTLKLWEIGCGLGSRRVNNYLSIADLGIYCLDLSQSLNREKIIKTIGCFREVNPLAPIFLVGTKEDLLDDPGDRQAKMDQLTHFLSAEEAELFKDPVKEKFNRLFYTSSLNNQGIATLSQSIFDHFIPAFSFSTALDYLSPESQLYLAIVQLKKSCDKLSSDKAYRIAAETLTLMQMLTSFNQPDPSEPIKNYLKKCEAHLNGQNQKLKTALKLIAIVGIIALINVLTAGIIFGVGLWFGWWMGPALLHNILITTFSTIKGQILVGSIATLGVGAEGLALYGLFGLLKDTPEISAIKKVAFNAKSEFFSLERSSSC